MEEHEAQPLTPLDLRFLARELGAELRGGTISKVYQYGKSETKQLLLEASCPGKGSRLLYWDPCKAFLTERKNPIPVEPPNLCMFLRKHLMGQKIMDIRQHKLGSVLEMVFREHILVLEFMPWGNAILCDSSYSIIMPLEIQKWRDRIVKPKTRYRHPPSGDNPLGMDFDSFHRLLNSSEKELGAVLGVNLGFGPLYSRELCQRAGLEGRAPARETGLRDALKLHSIMKSLLDMEASPVIYQDMVSPLPLRSCNGRPVKQAGSFSQALDEFFSGQPLHIEERKEGIRREGKTAEAQKGIPEDLQEIRKEKPASGDKPESVKNQAYYKIGGDMGEPGRPGEAEAGRRCAAPPRVPDKWERIAGDSGETAGLIRKNLSLVESVLSGIGGARESGLSWEEIKEKVTGEQTPEAEAIREIREGDALVVVELGGRQIELDLRLGAEENAEKYQEDMMWAEKKLAGGEEDGEPKKQGSTPVQSPEEKPPSEKPEAPQMEAPKAPDKPKRRRRKWFEKFHWFLSSDGFLVIGGKDAKQNEMIINKHMGPGDLVFHADKPGASLVLINSGGKGISEYAKKEAAELAAACSRPWTGGLGNTDIFCVKPDQVSGTPAPGEYLPRGGFMIAGGREWFRDLELKLSIGIAIDREKGEARPISGPVMPVRTHSDYFATIRPGFRKSLELAREIKNNILIKAKPEDKFLIDRVPLEDIQRLIPPGSGDLVEYGV